MSEIKGQLLGIVLAIALFGVVFGIMVTAFGRTSTSISSRMAETAETTGSYSEFAAPGAVAAPAPYEGD